MHVAVRPPLATAVALVGAGAIALSPIQPPLPDVAAVRVSEAAVHLVAQPNPLALWSEVIAGAIQNAGGLGQEVLSDPVPVLRQLLKNQLGYLGTVGDAGKGIIEGLAEYFSPDNPFGLQAGIRDAVAQIKVGQIAAGFATLTSTIIAGPLVVGVGLPLLTSGLLQVPVKIAQNVAAAVGALFDNTNIVPLLTAAISPIIAPINAFGESVQDVVQALGAGHLLDALTAVINVPARLVGAVLNGYTDVNGTFAPGLLSVSDNPFNAGLLQSVFVNLPRAIAAALGAETPATTAKTAKTASADAVATASIDAAATVTLTVPASHSASETTEPEPAPAPAPGTADAAETAADADTEERPAEDPAETPVDDDTSGDADVVDDEAAADDVTVGDDSGTDGDDPAAETSDPDPAGGTDSAGDAAGSGDPGGAASGSDGAAGE
ncbi:hypothetical protein [Mycolicibacterium chlorophenolicum]|uniref:PE-PGRS family protein n=1 Tax=Mycolicibacterium chlorophenolicum TaxID=37916 RepID=A0A0J6ZGD3_9MYCO|nr:hypothetical protein [Mycolicibacterium chlorophenolicum]KMO83881.1 hypothetical protein MCHLDSM_00017 [Mycolicibacterium chlorophenolicum]